MSFFNSLFLIIHSNNFEPKLVFIRLVGVNPEGVSKDSAFTISTSDIKALNVVNIVKELIESKSQPDLEGISLNASNFLKI